MVDHYDGKGPSGAYVVPENRRESEANKSRDNGFAFVGAVAIAGGLLLWLWIVLETGWENLKDFVWGFF